MRFLVIIFFSFTLEAYSQNNLTEEYIKNYYKIAISEMHLHGIPASITLAQGILESGNGKSHLAKKSNNHFGIKCHKNWKGKKVFHDDDEKKECFRKYKNPNESFKDHSLFLKERDRYSFLFRYKTSDYKSWSKGLKKAGYATNPNYANKLIELIEKYNLHVYDVSNKNGKRKIDKNIGKNNREILKSNNNVKYVLSKKNDTYDLIAHQNRLWLWQILDFNDKIKDENLEVGEIVFLEPKRNKGKLKEYKVKKGDTIYSISQKNGIKLSKLKKINNIDEKFIIKTNQIIYLRK